MSISNPSHRLISRNPPRSPAHPQLAHASTSRHAPSASLSASLPPTILGTWTYSHPQASQSADDLRGADHDGDESSQPSTADREDEQVDIHPTFRQGSALPGKVKVIVGRHDFWCHKEVLWFASPFFQGLLEGNWAETLNLQPTSTDEPQRLAPDTDTANNPLPLVKEHIELPSISDGVSSHSASETDATANAEDPKDVLDTEESSSASDGEKGSIYLDAAETNPSMTEILRELRELPEPSPVPSAIERNVISESGPSPSMPMLHSPFDHDSEDAEPRQVLADSRVAPRTPLRSAGRRARPRASFSSMASIHRPVMSRHGSESEGGEYVEAIVELHEESAAAFQDFLFWCYPHLECKVSWTNVENLLGLSLKLLTPALQKLCEHFLITHASGRPVIALMLAEQHGNSELYREASRFVLDQPTWATEEMDMLSEMTQLKLSKRRNWFLERLLKLGSIDVKKEYTCRPDCPDPARCQAQLDEKWRQAHNAVSRYGPPQPSVAFRCLRQLEVFPTNPSLVMPHPLCQSAAKSWVLSLFDRMFQPKMAFLPHNPGTEKYWLCISMD